jgi:hypothetical protein
VNLSSPFAERVGEQGGRKGKMITGWAITRPRPVQYKRGEGVSPSPHGVVEKRKENYDSEKPSLSKDKTKSMSGMRIGHGLRFGRS